MGTSAVFERKIIKIYEFIKVKHGPNQAGVPCNSAEGDKNVICKLNDTQPTQVTHSKNPKYDKLTRH